MKKILTKGMIALFVVAFCLAFAFAIAPMTYAESSKHSITYNLNGGIIGGTYATEYVETIGLKLPTNVTKDGGYVFMGWYETEDFTGDEMTEIGEDATNDVVLYAYWLKGIDLSTLTSDYTVPDGEGITGVLGGNYQITIAAGATVVFSNVAIERPYNYSNKWSAIVCEGDATIILKATNRVFAYNENTSGIFVPEGYTLTIEGSGELNVQGAYYGAGIGSGGENVAGNIIINSGIINATGGEKGAGIGSGYEGTIGDITINGGIINATGGRWGAGIGTGHLGVFGTITVNDGKITATGGKSGAGIGGGNSGSGGIVTIKGGTITATGGDDGAGIGTGYFKDGVLEDIVIEGGVIEATGGVTGAGIGTGYVGICGDIIIKGGTITATGGEDSPGIGCNGSNAVCGDITIYDTVTLLTATKNGDSPHSIGRGDYGGSLGTVTINGNVGTISASPFVFPVFSEITYILDGGEIGDDNITQYKEGSSTTLPTIVTKDHAIFEGWYVEEDFSGTVVTAIDASEKGDKVYYAKWANANTITYHLNGGEWKDGISAPTIFKEGVPFNLFAAGIVPVKTGKAFNGWYTSETLEESTHIDIIQANVTEDVELWAMWATEPTIEDVLPTAGETEHKVEDITVTATADENGFVLDATHSITITLEDGLFPDAIYLEVAEGYEYDEQSITTSWGEVFRGGYSDIDGSNYHGGLAISAPWPLDFKAFDGSIEITISDIEKTLVFKQIHLRGYYVRTVTYNVTGGTMPDVYETAYLESYGLELAVPTRNAYIFRGWYETEDFTGDPVTKITSEDSGNKVYYAKWEFVSVVDLSTLTGDVVIYDGQTITGELNGIFKVTIADGATVTLKDVTINGENNSSYAFAGITLEGDATILLDGNNTVKSFYENYPGIYVPENKTLTINGDGTLDVSSNGSSAGIGAGSDIPCGNIVIEGGTITATGGANSAGIGGSNGNGSCGNITINGGTITATGGENGAGIGSGKGSSSGIITITDGITKVTAVKGKDAQNSIGAGVDGTSGKVVIDGDEFNEITDDNFVYNATTAEELIALINEISTMEYSDEYKSKTELARAELEKLSSKEREKMTQEAISELEKEEETVIAGEAGVAFANLPESTEQVTTADKNVIEKAREAYEALTEEQKANFPEEELAKLEAAEMALAIAEVKEQINVLPETTEQVTTADKNVIEKAREAYEALTEEQKANFPEEELEKLEAAETALALLILNEELETLPATDEITLNDKESIEAARAAYDSLSDEEKEKVDPEKVEKLEEAETALAIVVVEEQINELPDSTDEITLNDKESIEAARTAYDSLPDESKEKVDQDKLEKLEAAETEINDIEKANEVNDLIDALPQIDDITFNNYETIISAKSAYNALTPSQKAKVPTETVELLTMLEEKATFFEEINDTCEIIDNLGEISYSAESKAKLDAALETYNNLSDEQKELMADDYAKLQAALNEYDQKEANATRQSLVDSSTNVSIETSNGVGIPKDVTFTAQSSSSVKVPEDSDEYKAIQSKLKSNEEIHSVYEIKLTKIVGGAEVEVQPSEISEGMMITIRLNVPEGVNPAKTRILHVYDANNIEFVNNVKVEENQFVFSVSNLREFVIVVANGNYEDSNQPDDGKDAEFVYACSAIIELIVVILINATIAIIYFVALGKKVDKLGKALLLLMSVITVIATIIIVIIHFSVLTLLSLIFAALAALCFLFFFVFKKEK